MPSSTENVKLGVCTVIYDGQDLGYTKGGVEVSVSTNTHEITIDQFGDTPIGELITGRMVSATVPLAETTLEKLVAIMPGSTLITDGVAATATVTFVTAPPAEGDSVTINGVRFEFTATPAGAYDLALPASVTAAATAFAAAVNAAPVPFIATVEDDTVLLTSYTRGVVANRPITRTGTSITVTGASGGVDPTRAKVVVSSGININLLSIAAPLVLRPRGTEGEDDFTIHRAATAGALNFSYNTNAERIYSTEFKGYVEPDGSLFSIGDIRAE